MRLSFFTAVTAVSLGHAAIAAAQCAPGGPPNPPGRRGALTGIVMDSAHYVLDAAEVFIDKPARKTRTGRDGRFVLDSLKPGIYTVTVRKIGHEMAIQDYQVADSGSIARFCLIPEPQLLKPVISSASRIGLGGIVGDTTLQPLAGAEVVIMATASPVKTDSSGEFFVPLKPGTYAVVVTKEGYGRQMLSVTIPKDSGRQIAVWLGAPPRNPHRAFAAYDDMRIRLNWANANRFALLSSERLSQMSADLRFAAQAAIKQRLPPICYAIVDGGPFQLPLDVIDKADVATMEIHLEKPRPGTPTSINSAGTSGGSTITTRTWPPPTCGAALIYVWLR